MVMPYLTFNGQCEEAFRWYADVFGGSVCHMLKAGEDGPVLHAQVMLMESGGISGSDTDLPVERGNAMSIQAHLPSEAQVRQVLPALAEGGAVLVEITTNPPPDDGSISCAVRDRYGVSWVLSASKD